MQTANSKQQTANSKQQTANSKQQTANSKQQTANSKQQTANSKQPRIVFINYANDQYKYQQKFALMTALKLGGFTEAKSYSPKSIDEKFRNTHSEILNIKRGNGLWLWKPYIILDALKNSSEGDYIFYCDSGAFFIDSVMPLIESMGNSDIWVSDVTYVEGQWTKPKVFELLGINDPAIKSSAQIQAGFVLVRKSKVSCEFISEWLNLCTQPELIKPLEPDEYHGECIEHREDQSMLSLLCKMRGIKPHRNPSVSPLNIKGIIKTKIKKLLGSPVKWLGLPLKWHEVRRVKTNHDSDKYSPCIYLHRIRHADSIHSIIRQVMRGKRLKVIATLIRMIFTK